MRRGDIFLANLGAIENSAKGSEQAGIRPVIIVSRDAINANSPVVIVVPVTGRENKKTIYPSQQVLNAGEGGLSKESVALCEQVRAISVTRLRKQMGNLGPDKMAGIANGLKIALDL
jgi:mRNA interferase MazF